jgi:hypothetical protein
MSLSPGAILRLLSLLSKLLDRLTALHLLTALPCLLLGRAKLLLWALRPLKAAIAAFSGERHVLIVKREPTGSPHVEWCAFEEREGLYPQTTPLWF